MLDERYETQAMVLRTFPAEQVVDGLAEQFGLPPGEEIEGEPGDQIRFQILWSAGGDMVLHYMEDAVADECFVFVSSSYQSSVGPWR